MRDIEQGILISLKSKYDIKMIYNPANADDEISFTIYDYLKEQIDQDVLDLLQNALEFTIGLFVYLDEGRIKLFINGKPIFVSYTIKFIMCLMQDKTTKIQIKGEIHAAVQLATKKLEVTLSQPNDIMIRQLTEVLQTVLSNKSEKEDQFGIQKNDVEFFMNEIIATYLFL